MKNYDFFKCKYIKQNENGVTLITLIVTIVILAIIINITINSLSGENGIIKKASEAADKAKLGLRIEELEMLAMEYSFDDKLTDPVATIDFVQPFMFNDYTESQIKDYVKTLKRAGYDEIIIQHVMNVTGGKNNDLYILDSWYDSNLISNISDLELYKPDVLDTLVEAISDNKMKVYIGLASSSDWWKNDFENSNWRTSNINLYNYIIDEIYERYGSLSCFGGIYWSFEMYSNNKNYQNYWIEMLNSNIQHINLTDQSPQNHRLIISPYVSSIYDMNEAEVYDFWTEIVEKVYFRSKDIICMQDCLGTSSFDPSKVLTYITATKVAVENDSRNLQFWLNVEAYSSENDTFKAAPLERYKLQLSICSSFATKLASFSYSHYYSSSSSSENNLDKEYRKYYTSITGETRHKISVPERGSVYEDDYGNEAPLPYGFEVSDTENIISNGLVVHDSFGNEYVWIPVNGGIKSKGYTYLDNEYKIVYYSRYIRNGVNIDNTSNDYLPNGVNSDETQIEMYGGFYVGRYECSYNYNNGVHAAQVKYSPSYIASDSFAWQYADSDIYTGRLLNSINYIDAKTLAERMSSVYNYLGVKTGIINGTQWDTMLKWFHSNDNTFTKIYNGTTWGNYTDSVSPATDGNYAALELKASGSNENWKFLNIYDVAGNLAEWTSELISSTPILRSNGYNGNGQYGSPAYGWPADPYQYPNVGFRVVLYIL